MIRFLVYISSICVYLLHLCYADTSCPDGWLAFHGSCYLFPHDQAMPFNQALYFCEEHKGHLVRVDSDTEKTFLKNHLRDSKAEEHWLGINDLKTEGIWVWQDTGAPTNVTDWLPGQPGSEAGQEDCAVMAPQYDYRWADLPCSQAREPLCERKEEYDELSEIIG